MFKRIYALFVTGTLLCLQPAVAARTSTSDIEKIVKKNGKIVVTVKENGKSKEIILSKKDIEKLEKKKKKRAAKLTKSRKVKKKESKKNHQKLAKKTDKKTSKQTAKKENKKATKTAEVKKGSYVVKIGDTLFSIARQFKVSISDLVKVNKLKQESLIYPGDVVKIPKTGYEEAAKKAVSKNKKTVYTVKRGDTLYSIAKKYKMKTAKLRKLNNLIRHPKLKPGMELTVVGTKAVVEKRKIQTKYAVRKGDTLWKIANKFNLTIAQLKLLNPKIRTRALRRGSILNISKKKAIALAKDAKKRKKPSRLSGVLARYQRSSNSSNSSNSSSSVVSYAKRFLGTRYVWGASRPGAFDCSGFTQYVMKKVKGRVIPRVSRRQAYYGRYITRRNLRAGDLIFFDTSKRRRGYVNHVAIYIGNNMFIHASSAKHRVVITSLNKPFYSQRFMWGRRIN